MLVERAFEHSAYPQPAATTAPVLFEHPALPSWLRALQDKDGRISLQDFIVYYEKIAYYQTQLAREGRINSMANLNKQMVPAGAHTAHRQQGGVHLSHAVHNGIRSTTPRLSL